MAQQKFYYYRTSKETITGLQLLDLMAKAKEVELAAEDLVKEVGTNAYTRTDLVAKGGIETFIFKEKPDPKIWQYLKVEFGDALYIPKEKTLKGKLIREKMNNLPVISGQAYNAAIGVEATDKIFGMLETPHDLYIKSYYPSPRTDLKTITKEEYQIALNVSRSDC